MPDSGRSTAVRSGRPERRPRTGSNTTARVADTRRDWQHKLSTRIIRDKRCTRRDRQIRSGRLRAVRIGKQYRTAEADLAALTGRTTPPGGALAVEVSSIVQVDGVDRTAADRLGTLLSAGAKTVRDPARPLRIQTVHDDERNRMKIVLLGGRRHRRGAAPRRGGARRGQRPARRGDRGRRCLT